MALINKLPFCLSLLPEIKIAHEEHLVNLDIHLFNDKRLYQISPMLSKEFSLDTYAEDYTTLLQSSVLNVNMILILFKNEYIKIESLRVYRCPDPTPILEYVVYDELI